MVKRIIWSDRAQKSLNEILTYWIERIGTKQYSRKLYKSFKIAVRRLAYHPQAGRKVENAKSTYFWIVGDYKIFYSFSDTELEVLHIWDTRRNPDDLKM